MSGGRWDPQTRIAVVVVGLLVVTVGVLTTVQWRSGIGSAALVIGGLLVGLAGVAGGTIFGPRETPEIHITTGEPPAIGSSTTEGGAAGRATDPTAGQTSGWRKVIGGDQRRPVVPPAVLALEAPPAQSADGRFGTGDHRQLADAVQAGEAHEAGDTENAIEVLVHQLRQTAPYAVTYHEAVREELAVAISGRPLRPATGQILGPLLVVGLPIAVDIRAGTGFSLDLMRRTYRALFDGSPPVDAVLVVVNTADPHVVAAVGRLREQLHRPVVAVPWRVGEPSDRIGEGMRLLRREVGHALDPARRRPPAQRRLIPATPVSATPVSATPISATPISATPVPVSATPVSATPISATPVPVSATPVSGSLSGDGQTGQHDVHPSHPGPTPADWPGPVAPAQPVVPHPRSGAPVGESAPYDDSIAWQYASELHWRGQLQEAEAAYRSIVDARTRARGWDDPSTLTARDQHATVLRDLDRIAEALEACDEVLHARVQLLGEDHVDTLTSRSHLATIYHQLGDLARAETEHHRVLDVRVRVLGANHQETLISRSNLAKVYQDLGELGRAIFEHQTVMQQRAELLGPEHRDTLMSRSLLASALHLAGRLAEAEVQHRGVLRGRLHLLGPAHIDTAVSRHRLASVLHDLGRLDEAATEYRAAREAYTQLLGASSPFARAAASDLALAERASRAAQAHGSR